MDPAGDKPFAGSCLTTDEDSIVALCDLGNARKNRSQSRRGSNDLFKHGGMINFLAKSQVLLLQSLFCLLAIFDIG